jgi:ketosteroid isomerase-like protein
MAASVRAILRQIGPGDKSTDAECAIMDRIQEVEPMTTDREAAPRPDREGLMAAFRAVQKGLLAGDTDALRDLYAEDFRSHSLRGDVEGREAVLEAFGPGGVQLEMFEVEDLAVEVKGEVGVLTGLGQISGRAGGAEFRHRVRFVDIFLRCDGRWRYWFSQSTEIVPDAG